MLHITRTVERDVLVLALAGKLGTDGSAALAQALDEWIDAGGRKVVLDLHHVPFIGSQGLAAIMQHAIAVRKRGGQFVLASVSDADFQVFDIGGCSHVLTFAQTSDEALRAIAA